MQSLPILQNVGDKLPGARLLGRVEKRLGWPGLDDAPVVHEQHPACTIQQLRDLLTDRTQYIFQPEAVAVCDAHIKAGYGDVIPYWR